MQHSYEVEIKSLLGSEARAKRLIQSLKEAFPNTKFISKGKQINHYFNLPEDLTKLIKSLDSHISPDRREAFENILKYGQKTSVRTRDADGKVILVIKASVGDDTSSNGVKRIEFESVLTITLLELDKLLLGSGCAYQAKWSREREEYECGDMRVCIDKNAGYGYIAEFEKVTKDEKILEDIRKDLLSIMKKLEIEELAQDRLERMFAYYNANWEKYYGTNDVFNIK